MAFRNLLNFTEHFKKFVQIFAFRKIFGKYVRSLQEPPEKCSDILVQPKIKVSRRLFLPEPPATFSKSRKSLDPNISFLGSSRKKFSVRSAVGSCRRSLRRASAEPQDCRRARMRWSSSLWRPKGSWISIFNISIVFNSNRVKTSEEEEHALSCQIVVVPNSFDLRFSHLWLLNRRKTIRSFLLRVAVVRQLTFSCLHQQVDHIVSNDSFLLSNLHRFYRRFAEELVDVTVDQSYADELHQLRRHHHSEEFQNLSEGIRIRNAHRDLVKVVVRRLERVHFDAESAWRDDVDGELRRESFKLERIFASAFDLITHASRCLLPNITHEVEHLPHFAAGERRT